MQSQNEHVIIRIIIKTKKSNAFQHTKANPMTLSLIETTHFNENHTLFDNDYYKHPI